MRSLARLDELLRRAIAAADAAYAGGTRVDAHRGLYVGPDEVARLLAREPGVPVLGGVAAGVGATGDWSPLAARFGLDEFDLAALLVALAPDVDLRYERLYAYLQDDVTRKRPTVELVLDLLCATAEEKLERRRRFAAEASLLSTGLVRLAADPGQPEAPLLSHFVAVDEHIVELLLGGTELDPRLAPVAELEDARGEEADPGLVALARGGPPEEVRVHLHGPAGSGRRAAARALAAALGRRLLAVDLQRALDADPALERLPALALREALAQHALLYLHGGDVLEEPECGVARRRLADVLRRHVGPVALATDGSAPGLELQNLVEVPFGFPDVATRRRLWSTALAREGVEASAADLDVLAGRFRLSAGRIESAAVRGRREAVVQGSPPGLDDLLAAARAQSGAGLGALARKILPRLGWDDIVLPPDRLQQLRELEAVVRHRPLVYEDWGFDRRLSLGKGISVLFAGPSGTGKTMAAEILAGELGLDLYAIDLAAVVSKYIGETEKNLARIFSAAEESNAVLFFDEADALFGKRSEVRDAHDRYANIEVAYLLQRVEAYEGVVILASNLRKNMDDAFVRRLYATVEFPFPDEEHRRRIWEGIWPRELPRADDLDLDSLARRFELSGGNIRNIALAAAFLAADDGRVVTTEHVMRAMRRELQKIGKVLTESELRG